MSTPDCQPPLPPEADCEHGVDSWTLCGDCLANITDDNGVLGRVDLIGMSAGLALDIRDGQVTAYMLHAWTAVFGSGGVSYAWVTADEAVTTEPDVVLAEPTFPVAMPTQELADFCELVSEWATILLPLVEWAVDNVEPKTFCLELALWAEEHGIGVSGIESA